MDKIAFFTISLFTAVVIGYVRGFYEAPVDVIQGQIYRIIFLHVPAAFCSFLCALVLFVYSIAALKTKKPQHLFAQRASTEVGLVLTVVTLLTGAIWGRPTWGSWWVWDARLTTTLLLALLFAGYLILYKSSRPGLGRLKTCSILGIIIFADVPIIYKSVDWWRTLHQGHTLFEADKKPISPEIETVLIYSIVATLVYSGWLVYLRYRAIKKADEVESLTLDSVR